MRLAGSVVVLAMVSSLSVLAGGAAAQSPSCEPGGDAGPDTATALPLDVPATCTGTMDATDGVDAFTFTAKATDRITISAEGVATATVYDPFGVELDTTSVADVHGDRGLEVRTEESGTHTVVLTGATTYTLKIDARSPAQSDCFTSEDAGTFLRSATLTTTPVWGFTSCNGLTAAWDSRDFYAFDTFPGDSVQMRLRVPLAADGTWRLVVWDGDGALLMQSTLLAGTSSDLAYAPERTTRVVFEVLRLGGAVDAYQLDVGRFDDVVRPNAWCPGEGFDDDEGILLKDRTCFGYLGAGDASDSYALPALAGDRLVARAAYGATNVRLLDPSGVERASGFARAEQGFAGVSVDAAVSGTWTVVVEGTEDYAIDAYGFDPLAHDDCDSGTDAPNLASQALHLDVGGSLVCDAALGPREDVDAYAVDAAAGQSILADLAWEGAGRVVALAPDGTVAKDVATASNGVTVDVPAPVAGRYTILVVGTGEHTAAGEPGDYTIALTLRPASDHDCGTGRDVGVGAGALTVAFPVNCDGSFAWTAPNDDQDEYTFAFSGGNLHVTLTNLESEGSSVTVLRGATTITSRSDAFGNVYVAATSQPAGTYTVRVSGGSATLTHYALDVTPTQPAAPPYWDCAQSTDATEANPRSMVSGGSFLKTCTGWLYPGIDTLDVLKGFSPWRGWPVWINVTFEGPGDFVVERNHSGTTWESASGSGTLRLSRPRDTYLSPWDDPIPETLRLELASATKPVRYVLRAETLRPTGGDCGGPDAAGTSLASGVTCNGRLVDGWRQNVGDRSDSYNVAVTDGDLLRVRFTGAGHSYDIGLNGAHTLVRPPGGVGMSGVTDQTLQVTNPTADLFWVNVAETRPDVDGYEEVCSGGGWGGPPYECRMVPTGYHDARSNGPFTYTLRADVTPNDRPVVVVTGLPAWIQDGSPVAFNVTVTDPDGDTVRPVVKFGSAQTYGNPDWETVLTTSPATGPSGRAWSYARTAVGVGTYSDYYVQAEATDAKGVPASVAPTRIFIDTHRADCVAGGGDAPASGRSFTGSCAGWMGAGRDSSDVLLTTAPAGSGVFLRLYVGQSGGGTVTTPSGEVVPIVPTPYPVHDDYVGYRFDLHEYTDTGGQYRIELTPGSQPSVDYTVTATTRTGPAPDGAVHLAGPTEGVRGGAVSFQVSADAFDTDDVDVTLDWGDGTPTETVRVAWGTPTTKTHTWTSPGLRTVTATGVSASGDALAAATLDMRTGLAGDCGAASDAPAGGRSFYGTCTGHVGDIDPEDLLFYNVSTSFGYHYRFTVAGASFAITGPDGSDVQLVDGVAHDWRAGAGSWRVRVAPLGPVEDATYTVAVTATYAPTVPTGAVTGSVGSVTGIGQATPGTLTAMDLDYEDVRVTLDWGDGTVQTFPASGFAATGTAWPVSHTFAATGEYAFRATGVARDGTVLAAFERILRVLSPDDCGAFEAPNTASSDDEDLLESDLPVLPAGICYGDLSPTDSADHYRFQTGLLEDFALRVCGLSPLGIQTTLWQTAGPSTLSASFVTTPGADGCVSYSQGAVTTLGPWYVLRVARASGAGVYEIAFTDEVAPGVAEVPATDLFEDDAAEGRWSGSYDRLLAFADSPHGFDRETDRTSSSVGWDASNGRIAITSDRQDGEDEIFSRTFGEPWSSTAGSFEVSATWRSTSQGNWQRAFPLFLAAETATDIETAPGTVFVQYFSRDSNLDQVPDHRLRYRDASGVLRIDRSFVAPHGATYTFRFAYDDATHVLKLDMLDSAGAALASGSYTVGSNADDGFRVGKVGVASQGTGQASEPDIVAWVDDIAVSRRPPPT